ncbi:MAG: YceI family protein [Methylobacillus sp.]|jgi:polyisoprenoid-binding protein YceI|nr:YceI family protein [Methylobacillus sp.]
MNRYATLLLLAGATTVAHAAPETYVTDANHTFANFSYTHLGYSVQMSRFDNVAGKIVLDRAARAGSVDITITTASVNTGSETFNEHIQGEDFLDTKQFPKATFKGDKVEFSGDQPVKVSGTLTLKGITKPVTLSISNFHCMMHPMKKVEACGANATTVVKRSDFNMSKYVPNVGDEVTINIAVEASKE